MKYRKFGKLDWQASALGFGAMRLQIIDGNHGNVDEIAVIKMMRYAIDHGVNYIDSAHGYHRGNSEIVIGKALQDGYRSKVKVATKLPCHVVNSTADFDRCLEEQMERLQTKQIDFYLLHHLNRLVWPKMVKLGIFKWADKAIADGRIAHFGFSFHDHYDLFKEIVDSYDNWTVAQIQYNFMDEEFQAGTRGLQYAYEKDLAVVIMEPLRGGRLTVPPENVAKIWEEAKIQRTPQEWGLRWVWNHPEVSVVLSGMSKMEQVVENVAFAAHSQPHNLTAEDLALIARVRDTYRAMGPIDCTGCRYCMPCPNGVEIPRIFGWYNEAVIHNSPQRLRSYYNDPNMLDKSERVENCIKCEICVEKCPQNLPIPELLDKAHAFLTAKG
jgi:predicted aldo/keto reductase-like oxidoreductase